MSHAGQVGNPGSGNVPSTTPSQGNDGESVTSGQGSRGRAGGGAAEDGGTDGGGHGGDGVENLITGSSVFYAGGGGATNSGPGGQGGGGQGFGYAQAQTGQSGQANTGGGGGSSGGGVHSPQTAQSKPGTAGGSGVVILKIPASKYTGQTSGSPTVTDSGAFKVLKYTGSGNLTT